MTPGRAGPVEEAEARVRVTEVHPVEWFLAFFAFVTLIMFSIVVVLATAIPVLDAFPTGSVAWRTLAAALAMGICLGRRHRGLLAMLDREGDPEAR